MKPIYSTLFTKLNTKILYLVFSTKSIALNLLTSKSNVTQPQSPCFWQTTNIGIYYVI